jgi:hypothetical protein
LYFAEHLNGNPVKIADAQNGVEVLEILEKASESLLTGGGQGSPRLNTLEGYPVQRGREGTPVEFLWGNSIQLGKEGGDRDFFFCASCCGD